MVQRALRCVVVAAGLWACSSGGDGGASDVAPSDGAATDPVGPAERDVAPVARYQFVPTPEGMTVEAVSAGQVQTFSCPTRTCAGLCDECAARACQASGELGGACAVLVSSCNDSCTCQGPGASGPSCGFPACTLDRMVCYVGEETNEPSTDPSGPGDPSPVDSAGRPNGASSDTSRPSF